MWTVCLLYSMLLLLIIISIIQNKLPIISKAQVSITKSKMLCRKKLLTHYRVSRFFKLSAIHTEKPAI